MAHKRTQPRPPVVAKSPVTQAPAGAGRRLPAGWPYLLLAGLTLLFFADTFFGGKIFLMRDVFCDNFPWRVFGAQALRSGHLPLWNPYSLCGQPYLANTQPAIFYPLHWIYCFLPAIFALKLWMALHLFLGAASMYALGRYWELDEGPSLLAGVAYAFSAYVVSELEFQSAIPSIVLTPLAVLLAGKLADAVEMRIAECGMRNKDEQMRGVKLNADERKRDVALIYSAFRIPHSTFMLGLLFAVEFLAGHQQSFLNGLFVVLVYLGARCLVKFDRARLVRCAAGFTAAGLLAIALCLPQLLMTLELIPLSMRGQTINPGLNEASFHPVWFLTYILPFLPGRPGHFGEWWGGTHGIFEFWAGAVYIGLLPLICASAAWVWLRRAPEPHGLRHSRRFLVLVCLAVLAFGVLMSLGKYTPLYMLFYDYMPMFNKFRWPSKFVQLNLFAMAALAGLGYQAFFMRNAECGMPNEQNTECGMRNEGALRTRLGAVKWMLIAWSGLLLIMAALALVIQNRPGIFTILTAGAYRHDPAHPERLAGLVADWRTATLFLALSLAALAPLASKTIIPHSAFRIPHYAQFAAVLVAFLNLMVIGRQIHPLVEDTVYAAAPDATMARLSREEPCRLGSSYMENMQFDLYNMDNPDLFRFAALALVGETALPHGIFRIHGGDNLNIKKYWDLKIICGAAGQPQAVTRRLLSLFNVRWMLQGPPMGEILAGRFPEQLNWVENPDRLPRALVVENWRVVADTTQTRTMLMDLAHDPYRVALLRRPPAGLPAERLDVTPRPDQPLTTLAAAGVSALRYGWNRVEIEAEARRPSLLVLNDVDYPGWRAFVDGKGVPIETANLCFRAVMLPEGRHRVVFTYRPARFYLGLGVSLATLLGLGGIFLWAKGPKGLKGRKGPEVA